MLPSKMRGMSSVFRHTVLVVVLVSTPAVVAKGPSAQVVEALNREGIELYNARKYHQAIEKFEGALRLDPKNDEVLGNLAGAWSAIGVELLNAGEQASARSAFETSISLAPDFYSEFGLGYIHFLNQEDEPAKRHLDASLKLQADYAKTYKFLALIAYRAGRGRSAQEALEKAVSLDEKDREAKAILERWRREAKVVGKFRSLDSKRFEIRYDPKIRVDFVERVATHLDAVFDAMAYVLGHTPPKRLFVSLYTEKQFHQVTGTHHWIGGVFDGQIKVSVTLDSKTRQETDPQVFRALQHELTHAFIKEIFPACPNWLNEGLAQYFELYPVASLERSDGAFAAARRVRRALIDEQLRQGSKRRLPFAKVPARLSELTNEQEARWTYIQGLGFVEELAARYAVFRLRILIETARAEGSLSRAFELTYGKPLEVLEEEWWTGVLE